MCGLVGAIAQRNVMPILIDSLKRLEYRGYDSAGLAHMNGSKSIRVHRSVGKVSDLEKCLEGADLSSFLGIGHTRWATHGEPNERNAHPHVSHNEVAVVHNGIIENYEVLKQDLCDLGYLFESDTDTEVIVHLIHHNLKTSQNLFEAVQVTVRQLSGAYAIAVMAVSDPTVIIVARQDSPLVIGVGDGEQFVASDPGALASVTSRFIFPEDGDVISLRCDDVTVVDASGNTVVRALKRLKITADAADKGDYPHYMLKEIHEQPRSLIDTLECHVAGELIREESLGFQAKELLDRVKAVHIAACGTSSHAGEVARYWLESLAGIPCSVELASEYRYRQPVIPPNCVFVGLSQSGETADTVAALRYAKSAGYLATLAICNVPQSTLVRESDLRLLTRAGAEIGVASTKAFTTQLLSMLMLILLLARRQSRGIHLERAIVKQMRRIASHVTDVLRCSGEIEILAARLAAYQNALFIGRGPLYPIAKEGALKLKEISYIHAEAYAAGELKHGPLALVDSSMPVIVLAPNNIWLEKLKSNLREVQARGGELYVFTGPDSGIEPAAGLSVIEMPVIDDLLSPISYSVAMQLLAYFVAVNRGTDIDKPRNLAKSVTVE